LARRRGTESYRAIHTALTAALHMVGAEARLIPENSEHDSPACFEKPVAWDIVDGEGKKLAGAGQRRTRSGLLHQGSVVVADDCRGLFVALAEGVALKVVAIRREPSEEDLAAMIKKFQSEEWLGRR
jgi:lipoate-protein ligase A